MSLQLGFSCDLEQVARPLGRGWKFQPNSASQLEKSLDSFNFNHGMPVGLGAEYNLICDLIHISHEWELVPEGISSSFWVISPCPYRIVFLFNWDLILKIKSTEGTVELRD